MGKAMAKGKAMKMAKDSESRSFVRRQEQEPGAAEGRRQRAECRETAGASQELVERKSLHDSKSGNRFVGETCAHLRLLGLQIEACFGSTQQPSVGAIELLASDGHVTIESVESRLNFCECVIFTEIIHDEVGPVARRALESEIDADNLSGPRPDVGALIQVLPRICILSFSIALKFAPLVRLTAGSGSDVGKNT